MVSFSAGLALLIVTAGPEPESLIGRLGSPRFSEREAASEALEKLGAQAFPVLRAARSDRDPEVKNRAEFLLEAIEKSLLTRPVTLKIDGHPTIAEVVEALGRAQGVPIQLADADGDRPFPLAETGRSFTYWKLLDRLNLAPQWDVEPAEFNNGNGMGMGMGMGRMAPVRRAAMLRLAPRPASKAKTSDFGPFRLIARAAVIAQEPANEPNFAIRPNRLRRSPAPADQETCIQIPLELASEPRLSIRAAGPIKIFEAVDNEGGTFSRTSSQTSLVMIDGPMGVMGESGAPVVNLQLNLKPPEEVGRKLTSLRGAIPVEIESRRIEPIVIPLAPTSQGERKPISCGGTTLIVHGLMPQARRFGGGGFTLELTVRTENWVGGFPGGRFGQRRLWDYVNADPERLFQSLELVDARGQVFRGGSPRPVGMDNDGPRIAIDYPSRDDGSSPTELRYHGQIRSTVEIPFEFKDLRLP